MIRAILIACLLVSSAFAETARRVPIQSVNIDAREFGVRTGSGVDNADALERLHDYLKASDIRHVVTFPPGLVQSSYTWWLSDLGSPGVIIDAYGTQFQSSSDAGAVSFLKYPLTCVPWYQTDARRSAGGSVVTGSLQNYGYLIDTAAAGSTSVTLQTTGDDTNFAVGDTVIVHGLDHQQTGTPRNSKWFDYAVVTAIDSGEITFDKPLQYTYSDTWPDVAYGSPSVSSGAPRICPARRENNDTTAYVEVRGAEFLGHADDDTDNSQPAIYSLNLKLVDCKGVDLYLGNGESATMERCDFEICEPDKLHSRLDVIDSVMGNFGGSTGVDVITATGTRFTESITSLSPRRVFFNKCAFAPPSDATAMLVFDKEWAVNTLDVSDCYFHGGSALDRPCVVVNNGTPRTFTTSSTASAHGAGQFGIDDADVTGLKAIEIGQRVWTGDGTAIGRVLAITHDGSDDYVVTVDNDNTFSTSSTLYFSTVNNVSHARNYSDLVRKGVVGAYSRDARETSRVIRLHSSQLYVDSSSYGNHVLVAGNINKIRMRLLRPTSVGGKQLSIGSQFDSDATFEGGFMRFSMTAAGDRYLADTGSTLLSSDVLNTSPYCLGWCNWLSLSYDMRTVDTDDLPEFWLEIYVDQPTEATDNGETVTAASPTLSTTRASKLNSSSNAVNATLGSGDYIGQIKTIVMTNASNSSTVSVTNHVTSDPEVFTFDAVDEYLVLMWTGTEWVTVAGDATTAILNPWYGTLAAAEHPATYTEAVPCLAA